MPPNRSAKSIAARRREAHKRGSKLVDQAEESSDPTYVHDSWHVDTPNELPEPSISVFPLLDDLQEIPCPQDTLFPQLGTVNNWQLLGSVPASAPDSQEAAFDPTCVNEDDALNARTSSERTVSAEFDVTHADADLLHINEVRVFAVAEHVGFTNNDSFQSGATFKQCQKDNRDLRPDRRAGPSISTVRRQVKGLTKKARAVTLHAQSILGFFKVCYSLNLHKYASTGSYWSYAKPLGERCSHFFHFITNGLRLLSLSESLFRAPLPL